MTRYDIKQKRLSSALVVVLRTLLKEKEKQKKKKKRKENLLKTVMIPRKNSNISKSVSFHCSASKVNYFNLK